MSATLLERANPIARKQHPCSCCLKTIEPDGNPYVRQTIVDNGDMSILKMHPACYSTLMDYMQFFAYDGDEGMPDWQDVEQWVAEGNMEPNDSDI